MVLLLALLLQQPPTLTSAGSQDVPVGERTALGVSPTGKYLVIVRAEALEIRDAVTLAPVKDLAGRWTAFGFDEREERFLAVGDTVTRLLVRDWTVQVQANLPNAKFAEIAGEQRLGVPERKSALKPGQAVVLSDLDFYYCTVDGGLSMASVVDGKLDVKPMKLEAIHAISRIFAQFPEVPVVAIGRDSQAAIVLRGQIFYLIGGSNPFYAVSFGTRAAVVGSDEETLYDSRTWKVVTHRQFEGSRCAAFDPQTGWIFVGDDRGVRAWHKGKFESPVRLEAFKEAILHMAADGPRRALFTLEKKTLRRWTISD
jgi:hypothetical protein